jgi:hypothetical protein
MTVVVDFSKRPGVAPQGWLLLAVGIACLAASIVFWQARDEQRQAREGEAEARAQALEQERQDAARPPMPSLDERRAQQAMRELRRPWLPTLQAIEAATRDPIYLLGWTIDPANGRIQLDGEAPSFEQALGFAEALNREPVLAGAQLTSHEQVNDAQNNRSIVKFTLMAQWRTP